MRHYLISAENSVAEKRKESSVVEGGQAADDQANALQFEELDHLHFGEEVDEDEAEAEEPNSPQHRVLLEELDLEFDGFAGLDEEEVDEAQEEEVDMEFDGFAGLNEELDLAEEAPLAIPLDNLADIDFVNWENDGVGIVADEIEDAGDQGQQEEDVHEDDDVDDDDEMYESDDDEETNEEEEDEQTDEEDELEPDLENLPPKRVRTPSVRLLQSIETERSSSEDEEH